MTTAVARGWTIRVTTDSGEASVGRAVGLTRDMLLTVGARMSLAGITRIDRRIVSGDGAAGGALFGAMPGAMLAVLLIGLAGDPDSGGGSMSRFTLAIIGSGFVVAGATLGALVGSVANPGTEHWVQMWSAQ